MSRPGANGRAGRVLARALFTPKITDTLSIELCMNEFIARREHYSEHFNTKSKNVCE